MEVYVCEFEVFFESFYLFWREFFLGLNRKPICGFDRDFDSGGVEGHRERIGCRKTQFCIAIAPAFLAIVRTIPPPPDLPPAPITLAAPPDSSMAVMNF